ncbi:hypothetical protein [Idiomarina sp. UBA4206]|uniref:hypothetical protein n=1 Tax=Idiomarina sp. UBA4206 TaxID=1946644 RepID=UPI0025799343|nr:hypothetical protein [Idiomarina sp. UBA4206]|tara:strand:- start:256 stop:498 length:243 start_codon:yes stop_codon:yes gene_type:complete
MNKASNNNDVLVDSKKRSYLGEIGAILVGLIAALLLRILMPVGDKINYAAILIAIVFVVSVVTVGYFLFRKKNEKDCTDD